jgi:predicted ATPase
MSRPRQGPISTRRIVLTGCPGGGKTTLLEALQVRGYVVARDSARVIIQAHRRHVMSPRPKPLAFAYEVLHEDVRQYEQYVFHGGDVFFDRGVLDSLCMLHGLGALRQDELETALARYPYHRQVFILPPWEQIYATDAERDQTFAEAVHVHRLASDWYRRCEYEVIEVPKVSVAERCQHVIRSLGASADL